MADTRVKRRWATQPRRRCVFSNEVHVEEEPSERLPPGLLTRASSACTRARPTRMRTAETAASLATARPNVQLRRSPTKLTSVALCRIAPSVRKAGGTETKSKAKKSFSERSALLLRTHKT